MATDPTRSIQRRDHPLIFDYSAADLLDRLGDLPAQYDLPYLTVTLDWQIDGGNPARRLAPEVKRSQPTPDSGGSDRPALREFELTINRLIEEHGPRGEMFDALQASRDRILAWLRDDLDSAAQGAFIVSHEPSGVFEATGLNLQVETSLGLSVEPRLYKLVRLIEDHPTYAVLQADQTEATLSFVTHGARDRSIRLESQSFPRKQQTGGLNQRRYRRRAEERMEAFARDTLHEVETALQESGVDVLILAGGEVMMSTINSLMPDRLKEAVVAAIRMEPTVTSHEKIEMTLEIAENAEREREQAMVDRLKDAIGQGDLGAAGPADTLRKLQNGQAETLVICDTFAGDGWADYAMHLFGVGEIPTEHPAGGDVGQIVPVDLRDEMIRLALISGAEIDVIHSAAPSSDEGIPDAGQTPLSDAAADLVEMGGVGAILRYAIAAAPNA